MNYHILKANITDAADILNLQKRAYISEAEIIGDFSIPPLKQTRTEINREFDSQTFLKLITDQKITGSVRFYERQETCHIGKLIVEPTYQNQGQGTALMKQVETLARASRLELFTGSESTENIHFYTNLGFREFKQKKINNTLTLVYLEKNISPNHATRNINKSST